MKKTGYTKEPIAFVLKQAPSSGKSADEAA